MPVHLTADLHNTRRRHKGTETDPKEAKKKACDNNSPKSAQPHRPAKVSIRSDTSAKSRPA